MFELRLIWDYFIFEHGCSNKNLGTSDYCLRKENLRVLESLPCMVFLYFNNSRLSVLVCVCVFFFISPEKLLLTEQSNKCNARDQASDVVLTKCFCAKNLRRHVIDNHSRDLQPSNCTKEYQLNWEESREVKGNS